MVVVMVVVVFLFWVEGVLTVFVSFFFFSSFVFFLDRRLAKHLVALFYKDGTSRGSEVDPKLLADYISFARLHINPTITGRCCWICCCCIFCIFCIFLHLLQFSNLFSPCWSFCCCFLLLFLVVVSFCWQTMPHKLWLRGMLICGWSETVPTTPGIKK